MLLHCYYCNMPPYPPSALADKSQPREHVNARALKKDVQMDSDETLRLVSVSAVVVVPIVFKCKTQERASAVVFDKVVQGFRR